jgi:carbon starvation protein
MNILAMLLISLGALVLGYVVYARYIAKVFHASDLRPTPATQLRDGVDYVPTPFPVLFSHHFATIAGAGPIVGPTIAAVYGIIPAWLWVVVGAILFGAVHDYSSMLVSLRERGRSIAEVTGNLTGRLGFVLYICFTLLMIVIVTAAFLDLSVRALTSVASAKLVQLPAANPFHWHMTVGPDGAALVRIGGIATTSVIVMTLFAPLIGWLLYKLRWSTRVVGAIAFLAAVLSVWVGLHYPVSFGGMSDARIRVIWMLILAAYVLLASAVPVWMILQGRDFINVFTLIGGMALLSVGCIAGGLQGLATDAHFSWQVHQGTAALGLIWPVLFITIACGAISGFHALVTGGTSGKQCARESDARRVGYGGMLTEGLLAVLVLAALGAGLGLQQYMAVQFPVGKEGNPVLSFSLGMGLLSEKALGIPVYMGAIFGLLMVEGFIITTLDTAVRLNRYLLEELWHFLWRGQPPAFMRNYYFNSGICVAAMLALALPNGWRVIWPVFGTANQLLAALTLATVSIWLAYRARPTWFTLLPAAFMMLTCLASLGLIMKGELSKVAAGATNWAVLVLAILLFLLSLGVIWLAGARLWEVYTGKREVIRDDPQDACLKPAPAGGGE